MSELSLTGWTEVAVEDGVAGVDVHTVHIQKDVLPSALC